MEECGLPWVRDNQGRKPYVSPKLHETPLLAILKKVAAIEQNQDDYRYQIQRTDYKNFTVGCC